MQQPAPEAWLKLPRRRYFTALQWHAAAIGAIAGIVLLVGYGLGFEPVRSLVPGFPTMKLRTATLLVLLTVSYLFSLRTERWEIGISSALAAAAVLLAAYTGLTRAPAIPGDDWSSIPSNATIFALLTGGVTLLLINHAPRWPVVAGLLALAAATPALFRILALILFKGAPDEDSPLNTMAIHTAALIVWFMLVCVILHPKLGLGRQLLRASLQGRLLRSMLPLAVLLPVAASAFSLLMSSMMGRAYESLFALDAALYVTTGAFLLWRLSSIVAVWQGQANAQAGRMSRANEALELYASSAAHDLKAPARHVLLYGELLEEALARGDMAAAKRHAAAIKESALGLPRLIDGMLGYARSAYSRLNLEDTHLSELAQAAAAQNAADLQAAGARVTVLAEARLRCDSTLMTTVFQNLIANAIKNRRDDRTLDVRIGCQREDAGWRIAVEDNGVGFDPDFAPVAFNTLARGVHTAGDAAGIGLATCRNIIQAHGGGIEVDAAFRNGARIVFTLPDAPAADGRHG